MIAITRCRLQRSLWHRPDDYFKPMEGWPAEPAKWAINALGASVLAEGRATIEAYRIFSDYYR